jgi:Cu+-exporting ATPase
LTLNKDGTSYSEKVISATLIHRGDILKVMPGARIAADGVLLDSELAYVDESMFSGESMPIKKCGKRYHHWRYAQRRSGVSHARG